MAYSVRSYTFICDSCKQYKVNEVKIEVRVLLKGPRNDDLLIEEDICSNCHDRHQKKKK